MTGLNLLTGRRVLLVEDDYFIAEEMCSAFVKNGAEVLGPVGEVGEALALISNAGRIDGAVLDIKLHDEMIYPVADALREREVPFVFATGYEETMVPAQYADVCRCEKPVEFEIIAKALFG
jgi:DNA-binding response OmpR family regulator